MLLGRIRLYACRTSSNFTPNRARYLLRRSASLLLFFSSIDLANNARPAALAVEWSDAGMDRTYGAEEACRFVKRLDFDPPPGPRAEAAGR